MTDGCSLAPAAEKSGPGHAAARSVETPANQPCSAPAHGPVPAPFRRRLTPAQRDIWLAQTLHPASTQFLLCPSYPIALPLVEDRFLAAVNEVFARQDALYARLVSGADGEPEMLFDPANACRCRFVDHSTHPDPQAALAAAIRQAAATPFQLIGGELARPVLAKIGPGAYCYYATHHHVMVDGWGLATVFANIAAAYDALAAGVTPAIDGTQFVPYLDAPREPLSAHFIEKATEFWRAQLASPVPTLSPAHADAEPLAAGDAMIVVPAEDVARLTAQATAANATLYHVCLLAFGWLLRRQFGCDPCWTSVTILNRGREHKRTVGMLTEFRSIPLPIDENTSVADNVSAIARRIRELFRYYRLPTSEITRLGQAQGGAGTPASMATLSFVARDYTAQIGGQRIRMDNTPAAHLETPLCLYVLDTEAGEDLKFHLVYQRAHLDAAEARQFLHRLLHMIQQLGRDRGLRLAELDALPPAECRQISTALDQRSRFTPPARPILEGILERARLAPDATAIEESGRRMSYGDLVARAAAIAERLAGEFGVQPGDRVVLLQPRSADTIAAMLGVMLAGAAYVPVATDDPDRRVRGICRDSAARCLITLSPLVERARAIHPAVLLADQIAPTGRPFASRAAADGVFAIIYTSGTTGEPKGVELSHQGLADHIANCSYHSAQFAAGERWLWFSSPSFDATLDCIYPALLGGHTLIVAPHPQWPAQELPRVLVEQQVHWLFLPPAYLVEMLKTLAEQPAMVRGHRVRCCISGGDVMSPIAATLWTRLFGPAARLVNVYGPTETTVSCTCYVVPPHARFDPGVAVPIGTVHAGRRLRIVDPRGCDVPLGTEGELLIGGCAVAIGYHARPELTAERFVTIDGHRYYRSGDAVSLRADGLLVFHRRLDQQVKIRGFRIELGEVEACLLTHPAVQGCAVLASVSGTDGDRELRAYVALDSRATADATVLRNYVADRLPPYMVPAIVIVDALPTTSSGKIDRRALLDSPPVPRSAPRAQPGTPLQGPVQEYLGLLWREVLGHAPADAREDFFAAGGHSLLAARLTARIGKAFRIDFPLARFFEQPTIEGSVRALVALVGDQARLEKMAAARLEIARLSPEQVEARLRQLRGAAPNG